MGRFWFLLGFFLLFISCPLLIMAIMNPDNSPLGEVFASIICHPDEEIRQYTGPVDADGSRSVTFYCENEAGDEREVTGYYILLVMGVFVVPFLSGLIIVISTSTRMARRKTSELVGQVWTQVDDTPEGQIRFESQGQPQSMSKAADILEQMTQKQKVDDTDDDDLSEKLRELQETLDQGLINEGEYHALRHEILRSFGR